VSAREEEEVVEVGRRERLPGAGVMRGGGL
jgi:hypothetical protein